MCWSREFLPVEVCFEAVELLVPGATVPLKPGVELPQRREPSPVATTLAVLPDVDEAGGSQHLQVPGHPRLVHAHDLDQLTHRALLVADGIQDPHPCRFRDRVKRLGEAHASNICAVIYMVQQIYARNKKRPVPRLGP